ncbi:MAG: bifunctional (p)ppGpp synthetase/guanosine-3',5'-bis(diphosphate) 3'-pyrophosphohydrolase [Deltaproteobacteria bacterium]|nr:bifunctional (p)ppGpp synthetase/guanosine-3',5'-bis(diphosphate) 3'-pyrophosphohydrolase [Deltaproteobacteria bacterium]MBT4087132.1 bifunctional (p)ppGpp synthetase/guanosine-3',5'-bis(diphosphate) 3'-pyrophosphohydrolase [Deltaproteobacteria bacterium]MBT4266308.1 bifunctional (p)ppGpp synthetase/guanosine-3',5'-bis(diphosphate) 3'-pyrophosphohydrolase [Deltaproteobacteria bacterium]MBT4640018.1 bifunctional (p)ppGpp synthetase/guanosine-3',5'-bis(diphosphate) 3'-pyrophosphohydrolase [Delt
MIRIENIIADFQAYTDNQVDCSPIQKAYVLVAKSQPYLKLFPNTDLQNSLEVAKILVDLKLDIQSIVSGLLHNVLLNGKISLDEIRDLMGVETANIVEGMHNILQVSDIPDEKERIAEKMRQMIFASSKDIRIIFVNLAARLVRIRLGKRFSNAKIREIANETLQTYAPIAERLGLSHIKTELEDLCFSYLNPKAFKEIDDFCNQNNLVHQSFLNRLHDELVELLPANQIEASVKVRIKHYYSIYLKAQRMGIEYDQLHDLLGVRIIVKNKDACYKVLGLISNDYRPVTESFKDYISFPKPNGYQSLHIDVYNRNGIGFDVQIRTEEMNIVAKRGVAAHWAYKENSNVPADSHENTSWLHDLSNSLDFASDSRESLEIFTRELYSDFVYVFTPKGKIIKLQSGAGVIDFAFAIHTELGHMCVGAKINGRNVSIKTKLKHGDKVEVHTSSNQSPSKDWLKYAVTSRALSNIRNHLRKEERQEAEKLGRELFAEQIAKLGKRLKDVLKSPELKKFLEKSGQNDLNAYYALLGYGKANISNIVRFFEPAPLKNRQVVKSPQKTTLTSAGRREGVRIAGIENMLVKYAQCCNPVKGDVIVGIVTQGQGVSIHLADCENVRARGFNPERLVDVEWIKSGSEKLPVRIRLRFDNLIKTNLQIMKILAGSKVVLVKNDLQLIDKTTEQDLTIKVDNIEQLDKILNKLNAITSVKAYRSTVQAEV